MDENIGKRFGRLTIVEPAVTNKEGKYYVCKCDCGKYKTVRFDNLKYGRATSCGCLRAEQKDLKIEPVYMSVNVAVAEWSKLHLPNSNLDR